MLVNHVTEETNPHKFPLHLRQQVMYIQNPYTQRISKARERIKNAVYYWQYLDAVMIYTKLVKEDAGEKFDEWL